MNTNMNDVEASKVNLETAVFSQMAQSTQEKESSEKTRAQNLTQISTSS